MIALAMVLVALVCLVVGFVIGYAVHRARRARLARCIMCHGTGRIRSGNNPEPVPCPVCHGLGFQDTNSAGNALESVREASAGG